MVVQSILIGVASSFAASLIFMFCLFQLRPKLSISPTIAEQREAQGQRRYILKVVNETARGIVNVRAEFILRKPQNSPGGLNWIEYKLGLMDEEYFHIPKFSTKDKDASYAIRLVCEEDLDEYWGTDGSYLAFRVIAQDAFSGFSRVVEHCFHSKDSDLKRGTHRFGKSLEVVPNAS